MKPTTRRSFLKRSAAIAGAASVSPYIFSSAQPAQAQEASDRLRVGAIGLGGQGRSDADQFANLDCDIVAICDVDSERIDETRKNGGINRLNPDGYKDYRRMLDRRDIDIITIGTVDHWHVKIAIETLMAGKHVHVQKPFTLTVAEGQAVRAALKKYPKLFCQVGTQQRWQRYEFATAAIMVRKGMLGDVKRMVVDIGGSPKGGPFAKTPPPESLDWDFWQGQCKPVDYIKERCHGDFRWWVEYSGGKFTDWGAHHVDFAHWALNLEEYGQGPSRLAPLNIVNPVEYKDGYPLVDDEFNACQDFEILCEMPGGVEMLVCSGSRDGNGVLIEGTQGRIHVSRGRIKGTPFEEMSSDAITEEDYVALAHGKPFEVPKEAGAGVNLYHKRDFVKCIRDGKGLPVSDGLSHIQMMQTCHLCGIVARLGREIKWDPKTEAIIGDAQAASFLAREQRKGFEIPAV